ncbi:site-specific integrase [Streptomyces sp. NPDC048420]|uniref:tyrosine-type recombinase/integrase n=1 Tax=Streptomyces sp. NPDC048420 TaxID=3155755 RepID=UPI00343BCF24
MREVRLDKAPVTEVDLGRPRDTRSPVGASAERLTQDVAGNTDLWAENLSKPTEPFDRWHKRYPKPERGDEPCRCGTRKRPLYPSADHGRGRRWQARYTDVAGKERRTCLVTWQEARDHLERALADIDSQRSSSSIGGRRVAFFATQMIERRRKRQKNANTSDAYESHLRNHVLPFAGKRRADTLCRRDSVSFVDYLLDKPGIHSPSTVRQVFKTWRILMHYMVDEDVPLPPNIVARIELPEVTPRVEVALSPVQVAAVAVAMRQVAPRYEVLIWLGACAGLRQGEAFGLRRGQVVWERSLLRVVEQRQHGKAVRLKTRASYATLPVDRFLIERLAEHAVQWSGPESAAPYAGRGGHQRASADPTDEDLIVTNRFDRPVLRADFYRRWRRAVVQAGLPERTRFHDLKHFYTSMLGASGDHDPKTVQALSRHAEFSETWDTYAHPPLAVEDVTVTAFGAAFSDVADVDRAA